MLMVYMMMQTQFNNKVGKKSHSGSLSIEIHKQKIVTKFHEDFLIKKQKNAPKYNNYLSSPRAADSATAVTGSRCPHSGEGETFWRVSRIFLRKQL